MCKLFNAWEPEIKKYCEENSLDFRKAQSAPKCWGKDDVWLQHVDPQKGMHGLLDETPAPVILKISKENGKLKFEQTEHTKKYLAQ